MEKYHNIVTTLAGSLFHPLPDKDWNGKIATTDLTDSSKS
jgi:hypothetical protein